MYDYLVVGAGLFGAVFAHEAALKGKKVKVIEKRNHIAGNIYTREEEGIQVHQYGAHIFHTSDKEIWDYVNQFAEFNRYTNSPVANYKGEIYNLPFNMNTFNKLWGVCVTVKLSKLIYIVPNLLVRSMEYMGTILMNLNSFLFTSINITRDMISFFNDFYFFSF